MSAPNPKVREQDPIATFLSDIEPVFRGKQVTYADLDAHSGASFKAVAESGLSLSHVLLIESDKGTFARLQETVAGHPADPHLRCLNLAVSDKAGPLRIKDIDDTSAEVSLTEITGPLDGSERLSGGFFELEARPFDDLIEGFPEKSVSIVKIGAEGLGVDALKSAEKAMSESRIDVVYIEAAMVSELAGRTYLHNIDEIMSSHGYSLFSTYEQAHRGVRDRHSLGRVNVAFVSAKMADLYPMPLVQELANLRAELREVTEASEEQSRHYDSALQDRFAEIAQLTELALRKSAPLEMPMKPVVVPPSHLRFLEPIDGAQLVKKTRIKPKYISALFLVLVYCLGVATPLVF